MALIDYTSYDEIRAALGVSATELTNLTLSQPTYEMLLTLALEDVAAGIPALYDTTLVAAALSVNQRRFLGLAQLYATYALARELLTSLPMFSVKSLTDGRAGFARQDNIFQDVTDNVYATLVDLKLRLAASYAVVSGTPAPTRTVAKFSVSVGLGKDPVTGV